MQFTYEQKLLLKDIAESEASVVNLDHEKSQLTKNIYNFQESKILDTNYNLTDKGLCYAITESNALFLNYLKKYPEARKLWNGDMKRVEDSIMTTEGVDIFYHCTFKTYLEWNWFNPNGSFKQLSDKEALKFAIETITKVLDVNKIPVDQVLGVVGIPKELVRSRGITKDNAKYVLKTMYGY